MKKIASRKLVLRAEVVKTLVHLEQIRGGADTMATSVFGGGATIALPTSATPIQCTLGKSGCGGVGNDNGAT